jgi:protein-arginine kinase activator protein McsA
MNVCTVCGCTLQELREKGLLGCVHCYPVFVEEISAMMASQIITSQSDISLEVSEKYFLELQNLREQQLELLMRKEPVAVAEWNGVKEKIKELKSTHKNNSTSL